MHTNNILMKVRGNMYKTTKGLVGSHGPAWQEVRSFVQVDMMRPRSAMFYIDTVDASSLQLCHLLQQKRWDRYNILAFYGCKILNPGGEKILSSRTFCLTSTGEIMEDGRKV